MNSQLYVLLVFLLFICCSNELNYFGFRQSYDVDIEAIVEATGCKSENTLDLKNPFFHYNGQPTTVPAGKTPKNLRDSKVTFRKKALCAEWIRFLPNIGIAFKFSG